MTNNDQENPRTAAAKSSKLAILVAFVAGAFAAWLIITFALNG